jgi:hypothetical protein
MTLPDPNTLDWGSMSKAEFKRMELAYELEHEDNALARRKPAKVVPPKTVPITEALAVAYAAYRINKNEYIKDIRRFEEASTQFPNKDLVRYYWAKKLQLRDGPYIPTDFEMFEPTEDDYANVQEALKWMKRYVMLGLGDLGEFKTDMVNELAKEEVIPSGRIAYAPEFIKRDQHESGLKKEIRVEYRDSQYLGTEKESVEAVIAILDKRYSSQWESYNYTAVTTEGNLVSFMNKFPYDVGAMLRCKAKVKAQTKNRLFEANETRLNYVKLYKV